MTKPRQKNLPQSLSLKKKQLLVILILGIATLSFFGLVSYKYLMLRSDYARVLSILSDESQDTQNHNGSDEARGSAEKYMDDVYQEPKLVEITEKLGIHKNNIEGVEMRIVEEASMETLPDGTQPIIDPNGVYTPGYHDNRKWGDVVRAPKIEIEGHLSSDKLDRVVAHEFLHHMYDVWWNKDAVRRFDQNLILFYMNNQSMRERLRDYQQDGKLNLTEIYAFACTEYSDNALGPDLVQICRQWFDRGALNYIY